MNTFTALWHDTEKLGSTFEEHLQRFAIAHAARQPGAVPEWFELVIRDVCELEPEDPNAADTVCIRPLDLRLIMERHALPAQAVDLSKYRHALLRASGWARRSDVTSHAEDAGLLRELLILIDSQAVGK